jgi:hypothetical protein
MRSRRKAFITALMIALATAPGLLVLTLSASAQFKPMSKPVSKEREESEQAQKKKAQDDGQYKSSIERLPDKKFDPWANMR